MLSRILRVVGILAFLLWVSASFVLAQDTTNSGGLQLVLSVGVKPADLKTEDVRATAEVLAHRLELLNIQNAVVQVLAGKAIQVQLPAMDDPQPVIDALTQTAQLELVDFSGLRDQIDEWYARILLTSGWEASPNPTPREDGQTNPLTGKAFETVMTGADFVSVETALDQFGQWALNFELSDKASQRFGDYTEAHIGEPLAITLDGRILSAPIIQSRLDKSGTIVGNFSEDEAKRLAAQLRTGALPLPLKVKSLDTLEEITVPDSST